jgi:hypothetical protein
MELEFVHLMLLTWKQLLWVLVLVPWWHEVLHWSQHKIGVYFVNKSPKIRTPSTNMGLAARISVKFREASGIRFHEQ